MAGSRVKFKYDLIFFSCPRRKRGAIKKAEWIEKSMFGLGRDHFSSRIGGI
jgi:hypothetical protein